MRSFRAVDGEKTRDGTNPLAAVAPVAVVEEDDARRSELYEVSRCC